MVLLVHALVSVENMSTSVTMKVKAVRYSFPQSEAIHTQIALKMKNEYILTKFCKKPTVYMP